MLTLILVQTGVANVSAADTLYYGFTDKTKTGSYSWPLSVRDDNKEIKIAYCFNAKLNFPPVPPTNFDSQGSIDLWKANGYMFHKITNASAEDMQKNSAVNKPEVKDNVLRVVYNGYPYDKNGIKAKYNLSDM